MGGVAIAPLVVRIPFHLYRSTGWECADRTAVVVEFTCCYGEVTPLNESQGDGDGSRVGRSINTLIRKLNVASTLLELLLLLNELSMTCCP